MEDQERIQEFVQKLQHDVNCLSDESRGTRKRALGKIYDQVLVQQRKESFSPAVLHGMLDFLLKPVLKMFSDPAEKCKEIAIRFIAEYLPLMDDITGHLPYIIPVIVARLGTQVITESSEEVRLNLVTLLTLIISISVMGIAPYLDDLITILQKTIIDPYPEIKKESCTCAMKLAVAIPATFYHQSESLAKPLFISMTHQHSKVRVACIKALGTTIQYGSPKPLDDGLSTLAQRACDSSPSVRACLADVVGNWLLDLPDRYSYHHKLIPLLFTCMSDDVREIKTQSHDLWEKIGAKYQFENEDDLKDKIDFMQPLIPAPFLEFPRPSLGCRILIYRCFSKILPAILRDLMDWTTHSRIKSSQLLYTLLYHLEDRSTHHAQAIVDGLYKACQDEESAVIDQANMCCQVLGYYVSPEVWCKLVLPAIRTSAGCKVSGTTQASTVAVGPVQCTSCLKVLVGLLTGSTSTKVDSYLEAIVDCLFETEVSQSEHLPLLRELLNAVIVATQRSGNTCHKYSLKLFTIILRVSATNHSQFLNEKISEVLSCLASVQNLEGTSDLYYNHSKDIVESFKAHYKDWNIHSSDCYLFGSLLSGAGSILGQLLDDIIPILTFCLNSEEPELRLHFITLLIRLLLNASSTFDSQHDFSKFASTVVTDIIIPNLVWKAGRTAAAIRTASMTCLQALLQAEVTSVESIDELIPNLLPKVLSCLDDDNQSTRLVSCKVLEVLLLYKPKSLNADKLHEMCPDLLKRMDDNSDDIRILTTETLKAYIKAFPDNYDKDLCKAHSEALFKGLLLHLDDPSSQIQETVLGVLKMGIRLNSTLLKEQVELVKHKHRDSRWCKELLQSIEQ